MQYLHHDMRRNVLRDDRDRVDGDELAMDSQEPVTRRAIERGRVVICASCSAHGTCRGFTNLVVRRLNGDVELDPHVAGSCVITLNEGGATVLRDALTEWLG